MLSSLVDITIVIPGLLLQGIVEVVNYINQVRQLLHSVHLADIMYLSVGYW